MATKISNMTAGSALGGTEKIEMEQSGNARYTTPTAIATYIRTNYRARVDNNVSPFNNVTVANNTDVAITFDHEVYDVGSFWTSGSPTRFTVPVTGLYLIHGFVEWNNGSTSGLRRLWIRRNGADILAKEEDGITTHTNKVQQTISTTYLLTAADYVELYARQSSGGSLDILQQNYWSPVFAIALLSL